MLGEATFVDVARLRSATLLRAVVSAVDRRPRVALRSEEVVVSIRLSL